MKITDDLFKWMTVLIVAFVFVAVLLHAAGFATAAGSLFTGLNTLGGTLEAGNVTSGGQKQKLCLTIAPLPIKYMTETRLITR